MRGSDPGEGGGCSAVGDAFTGLDGLPSAILSVGFVVPRGLRPINDSERPNRFDDGDPGAMALAGSGEVPPSGGGGDERDDGDGRSWIADAAGDDHDCDVIGGVDAGLALCDEVCESIRSVRRELGWATGG